MPRLEGKIALVTGARRRHRRRDRPALPRGGRAARGQRPRRGARRAGRRAARRHGDRGRRRGLGARSRACSRRSRERHGRLDVLVNNAGISGHRERPGARASSFTRRSRSAGRRSSPPAGRSRRTSTSTVETTDDDWRRMLAVHLDGTFFCTREALRIMNAADLGRDHQHGLDHGHRGRRRRAAYCAAKAGILGFTRSLAREVATRSIRVNAIAPGWIDTDMTAPLDELRPLHRDADAAAAASATPTTSPGPRSTSRATSANSSPARCCRPTAAGT